MTKKKSRVKSMKRSELMAAKWKDPTKGADGLTYAERMKKRAKDQRDREVAAKKGGGAGGGVTTQETTNGGEGASSGSSSPGSTSARPTPAPKSERRGWTPGRTWR